MHQRGEAIRSCHRAGPHLVIAERRAAVGGDTVARDEAPLLVNLRLRQTFEEGTAAVAALSAQLRASLALLT